MGTGRRTRTAGAALVLAAAAAGASGPPERGLHWLTAPGTGAVAAGPLRERAPAILRDLGSRAGWNPADTASLHLLHVHDLGHGPRLLRYVQEIAGAPVLPGQVVLLLRREDDALLAWTGAPLPVAAAAARPADALERAAARVRALAEADLGPLAAHAVDSSPRQVALTRAAPLAAPLLEARLRPIWYAEGGRPVAATWVETGGARSEVLVVGADAAQVLRRSPRRLEAGVDYRAYVDAAAFPAPYPNPLGRATTPHAGAAPTPAATYAAVAPRLVTVTHAVDLPHDDPWLAAADSASNGNDAETFIAIPPVVGGTWDAVYDGDFVAARGDFHAAKNTATGFDYATDATLPTWRPVPGDPARTVSAQDPALNAELVQAFYSASWLHDLLYVHGFTETAGNMQRDNYGRGGAAADPLRVMFQYATATEPTLDGASPTVFIDTAWDLSLFGHEAFHAVQSRLRNFIHDTQGRYNQEIALNEGWSDFMGLLAAYGADSYAVDPQVTGAYAVAGFSNRNYDPRRAQGVRLVDRGAYDPYWYGIRRYPTSTDLALSPLTFRHIEHGATLSTTPPYFNWRSRANFNSEGHTAGEIWTNALWGCFAGMVRAHGPDAARGRMLDAMIASIQLEPVHADYLEARNALLAVLAASDTGDYHACRSAFAQRGMGSGAVAPPRDSIELHGLVESFADADAALSLISSHVGDGSRGDGVLDVGDIGTLELDVRNSGYVTLTGAQAAVATAGGVRFPSGASVALPTLRPGETAHVAVPLRLDSAAAQATLSFDVALAGSSGAALGHGSASAVVNYGWTLADTATNFSAARAAEDFDIVTLDRYNASGYPALEGCWKRSADGTPRMSAADPLGGYRCALVTPSLPVATDADFVLHLDHAYDLRARGGGHVELSDDDGASWTDLEAVLGQTLYPGDYRNGRYVTERAFSGMSPGFPAVVAARYDFGRRYAGKRVRLRFVADLLPAFVATDGGWHLQRIAFDGVTEPVFHAVAPVSTRRGAVNAERAAVGALPRH